jgi:hypothetical protein
MKFEDVPQKKEVSSASVARDFGGNPVLIPHEPGRKGPENIKAGRGGG